MSSVSTIDSRAALEALYEENLYSVVRLEAHVDPEVKALATPLVAWEAQWWEVMKADKGLLRAFYLASAIVERIDSQLDAASDAVAVLARLEDKANKTLALMILLFGSLVPSVFKKPLMAAQFESMKRWPSILKGTTNEQLQKYGATVEGLLVEGDKALDDARTAQQKGQEFRLTGDRRALVDQLNAIRKGVHGKLGEIAHQKKYGNDFADSFFRHESGARELSLDEVERRLATAKAEVERLEGKRAELIQAAEMDAKARAEAEKKVKAAKLEAAEKAAAEAAAHLAALKAELGDS